MTSVGTSSKMREELPRLLIRVCRGATVSAQGLAAMMETSLVMKPASLAGGTAPDGRGDDNKAIHAG